MFPFTSSGSNPALLPSYGGKGMYGDAVHRAVIANRDAESGITIHYVNRFYDSGDIIFQAKCKVDPRDTPETLAAKVHALEYRYFAQVIEDIVLKIV
jgi:phosphoribosylglycinamide formyltransferase-1